MATPILRSSQTADINLDIEKGETWCPIIVWKQKTNPEDDNSSAAEVDLTNWSARMQIRLTRESTNFEFEMTTGDTTITLGGATGTIQPLLTDAQTESITWSDAVHDLELIDPTGKVVKFMKGKVKAYDEVTK